MQYNVVPNYTLELSSATSYYVGLPGMKTIWGERKRLEIESKFHLETYSDLAAGWARFGAAIGETKQIARCATS